MADHLERDPQAPTRSGLLKGSLLFVFALAVRLAVQHGLLDNPSLLYPLVDAGAHHDLALSFQSSDVIPVKLFFRSVFYPVYLGAVYFSSGSSILVAKLLQALLGAVTCLLGYHVARRYFGPGCGWVAGIIIALYGPLIFWESELVAVGWAAFWSVALLWLAGKARDSGTAGFHFAFGAVGAMAVLTRPSFLAFVLLTAVWLAWSAKAGAGLHVIKRLTLAFGGFTLLALPTALVSYSVADHPSFLPRSGALNLYLGNHSDRCEMLTRRPGEEWQEIRSVADAEGEEPRRTPPFLQRVIEQAWQNPVTFGRGIFHKLGQFANGREIPRNVDIYLFREWSPLLSTLVWKAGGFGFPFGLLFPVAVIGLILRRRDVPIPLVLLVTTYPLMIVATFVAGRYRAPLAPALSMLAAAGLIELCASIAARRWRQALVPLALVAGLVLLSWRAEPYCEEAVDFHSEMYVFVGLDAAAAGNADQAMDFFQQAVRISPGSARAHEELAAFYASQDELDLALQHAEHAIRISENYWLLRTRGIIHFKRDELDLAFDDFNRSIDLNPNYSAGYLGRGRVHIRRGERTEGVADILTSLRLARSTRDVAAARKTLQMIKRMQRQ